jgi:hypothetical protein
MLLMAYEYMIYLQILARNIACERSVVYLKFSSSVFIAQTSNCDGDLIFPHTSNIILIAAGIQSPLNLVRLQTQRVINDIDRQCFIP